MAEGESLEKCFLDYSSYHISLELNSLMLQVNYLFVKSIFVESGTFCRGGSKRNIFDIKIIRLFPDLFPWITFLIFQSAYSSWKSWKTH